jgi:hypothetical protein
MLNALSEPLAAISPPKITGVLDPQEDPPPLG